MESKTIGQRLREIRKKAGMSQIDVAKAMGKSQSCVTNVECDKGNPCLEFILEYASSCGCAIEWNFVPKGEETKEYTLK